eukprot:2468295-Pleurochrysis_carterae.AAC.1
MKLCSQGDGRDLDPSHTEAQNDSDRRGRPSGHDGPSRERESLASLKVPEYGGKQLGDEKYDLVSEDEDKGAARSNATAGGNYQLSVPGGGGVGAAAAGAVGGDRQQLQVELAARLLAKSAAKKKAREEKKARKSAKKSKKDKKRHKKGDKKEKKSHKKSDKKEKR